MKASVNFRLESTSLDPPGSVTFTDFLNWKETGDQKILNKGKLIRQKIGTVMMKG